MTNDLEPADGIKPQQLFNLLRRRAMQVLYVPNPPPVKFPLEGPDANLYSFAAKKIGAQEPITYLEFGVFKGRTIRRMTELFTSSDARFIGFDSFMGLPEEWAGRKAGHFSTEGNTPNIADKRVSFVKGYFQNSFTGFFKDYTFKAPVLVHFDADLYSSTLFLLTSLWHHIPEYYFIFDEFPADEAIAMHDFAQAFPVEYEFFAFATGGRGGRDAPQQLFGHMRRKAFTLP